MNDATNTLPAYPIAGVTILSEAVTVNGTTLATIRGGATSFARRNAASLHYRTEVLAHVELGGGSLVEVRTPGTPDRNFYGPALLPAGMVARKP